MNLYISDLIARERQSELLAEASRWRRRREATRVAAAFAATQCAPRPEPVYCRRAAALGLRSA